MSYLHRHHRDCVLLPVLLLAALGPRAAAQPSAIRYGERVPPDVKLIYERGLTYLASTQQEDGSWSGGQSGSGVTGLGLMAFLAHGEDPNYGQYSSQIQKSVRSIIQSQDPRTGYIPQRMYDHGFAMLALAEAYGTVDDELIWDVQASPRDRSIGAALELAVRCAVTSQRKNSFGAWRYSPDAHDADTSVSGAVLVGLLAARNAGIEVPDEAIDKALQYYKNSTSNTGMVAYSGGVGGHGESMNRSAIATLVYAVGKRKDWPEYKATLQHITTRLDHQETSYPFYFRYYMAQALFQGDYDAWTKWKAENTLALRDLQQDNGSFQSNHGEAYGTAMALLSLALDYRFLPIYER
jgi:hypothetical protein